MRHEVWEPFQKERKDMGTIREEQIDLEDVIEDPGG